MQRLDSHWQLPGPLPVLLGGRLGGQTHGPLARLAVASMPSGGRLLSRILMHVDVHRWVMGHVAGLA